MYKNAVNIFVFFFHIPLRCRGIWFRAVVKAFNKEKKIVTVFFVDYGETEHLDCADVRLDICLQKIPVETFRCCLHNLKPMGVDTSNECVAWPKDLINCLRVSVHQEFNAIVKTYFPLSICLRFPNTSESLTEFLVTTGKADYINNF